MFTSIVSHSPWYIYLLCVLCATTLTAFLYFRNKSLGELPGWVRLSLQVSRFISTFLILILLAEMYFKQVRNHTERPLLVILRDNSSSIVSRPDSALLKRSIESALSEMAKSLETRFDLQTRFFDSDLQSTLKAPDYSGKETDIDLALSKAETLFGNRNVGAVVLLSDGIVNKGANPVYRADKSSVPVFVLAIGDTTEHRDILLRKLNCNEVAYLGNQFPVEIHLQAWKLKGKAFEVLLYQDNVLLSKHKQEINSELWSGVASFSIEAKVKGLSHYRVEIPVLKEEHNPRNNSLNFNVEILDNREKILLLAQSPHPDLSAIRESVSGNQSYELECAYAEDFRGNLKAYSLVIFHGSGNLQKGQIEECRNQNIPFWLINPSGLDLFPGLRISASSSRFSDAEVLVNESFDLFRCSDALKTFLAECPAVKCVFGNYLMSNSSVPLLRQKIGSVETNQPIFVFNESSGSKSACFIADGLWRWNMHDFALHQDHRLFNELISSTVQFLAVKSDKSYFRVKAPTTVYENEEVEITAEVYNKSYEPAANPQVDLELTDSDNKRYKYGLSSRGTFFSANLGQLKPGEYHYTATAKTERDTYVKKGMLFSQERSGERMNTVADHRILYQLANRSGAGFYRLSDYPELIRHLEQSKTLRPVTYSESSLSRLIDWTVAFWIIFLAFVFEWWVRKRYLSI
ncbi:MAG TPA: VWA domain-containing protein [Bacteroidia bacterium]|nr:VWA domain-containing protein [Bacteroidia bacterium]